MTRKGRADARDAGRADPADEALDQALEQTFPASDPPSMSAGTTASLTSARALDALSEEDWLVDLFAIAAVASLDASPLEALTREHVWASPATAVRFATSRAGAVLRLLAELEGATPRCLLMLHATVPASCIQEPERLPTHWRSRPPPDDLRRVGDDWRARADSACLRLPSRLCTGETDVLFDPAHADRERLRIVARMEFHLDPRLRF